MLVPNGTAQQGWKPNTQYSVGAYVYGGPNIYRMVGTTTGSINGTSGAAPSSYPFVTAPPGGTRVRDNQVFWMPAPNAAAQQGWQPNTQYSVGEFVYSGPSIYVMVATAAGQSGTTDPTLQVGSAPLVTVADGDLLWGDFGVSTTPPSYQQWL